MTAPTTRGRPPTRLRFQLLAFSATRAVVNSGYRMVYPFLPVFARGLGVELQALAWVVTARSLLGAASPFLGSVADVRGRKWAMLVSLALFVGGFLLVPVRPVYAVFFGAMLAASIGKLIFDPAMQAYLGDRVEYGRRGLAIAITEVGWSAASLIGIPIIGWLIARQGWQAPFPWLAALAAGAMVLLWRLLPPDPPGGGPRSSMRAGFELVAKHPPAVAGLSVGLLTSMGNEAVNIMYGVWMEQAFGLQVAALGAATAVIGLAELSGEGAVAGLSDRLGKRRLVSMAIALNALASFALIGLGRSLAGALVGLFLFYLTFEVVIVGAIPLMTQVLPGARATVMAGNVAGLSLGRAAGAALGPLLFSGNLISNVLATAALDGLALFALLKFVRLKEEGD